MIRTLPNQKRFAMKGQHMRIALVAPLAEAVPPKLYGGTERVVSWLAEELVRQGHDVTLFASGGSRTAANLVICAPQNLRLAGIRDHLGGTLRMLREVRQRFFGSRQGAEALRSASATRNDISGFDT